jgi:uncharacterized integral membrane protein
MAKTLYALIIIVVGIIIFGAILIFMALFIANQTQSTDSVLKFIGIIISWPVALTIISLIFIFRFRGALDYFLRNIRSVNFPGGTINVQKESIEIEEFDKEKSELISFTPEETDEIAGIIRDLQDKQTVAAESKSRLENKLQEAYYYVTIWKFAYLNLFFVPNTKNVIEWFSRNQAQTRSVFHECWQNVIADAIEREKILEVAITHGILESDGNNIHITRHGFSFLQYIGRIPYEPQANT